MADSRAKVLFVSPAGRGDAFVAIDYEILSRHFQVTRREAAVGDPLIFVHALRELRQTDAAVVWFAGVHAYATVLAGRLLGKPVVLIPGYHELANELSLGYGLRLQSPWRWRLAMSSLSDARLVLAVSQHHRGILERLSRPPRALRVLYHGFDDRFWTAPGPTRKSPLVLTVADFRDPGRVWIKGLETFAQAAARLPEASFVVIGAHDAEVARHLQGLAEGRLTLTGKLAPEAVAEWMRQAQVYAQLSATESFGCALAEAMLCECVPVVTNRPALPEVTGEVGFYTEFGDVEGTLTQIRQALTSDRGPAARRRIQELFPLEKREQGLVEAVAALL